ncbi:MAG: hypothetical protein CTY37_00260 [Methylotenera sp.]|nr:MAG: hypothetical protein CTY37_00260 [Methylotenera sp.]PPD19059.1 MAG: hypothetical protein CTY27_00105 [Methylotenera sp.]
MYKTITYVNKSNSEEHTIRIEKSILDGLQTTLDKEEIPLKKWLQNQFMDLTNGGSCEMSLREIRNINEKIRIRILKAMSCDDF